MNQDGDASLTLIEYIDGDFAGDIVSINNETVCTYYPLPISPMTWSSRTNKSSKLSTQVDEALIPSWRECLSICLSLCIHAPFAPS